MNQSKSKNPSLIIITMICVACIIGCLGILALNATMSTTGMMSHVCVGLTTTPKWQFGLSWTLPISSYLTPLTISPYAVCTDLPETWITTFTSKMAGEWMFPP